MMEKKVRVYEMSQGESKNIQVIQKITLLVHRIDERKPEVFLTINPNITEFEASRNRQGVGWEGIKHDTRQGSMTPSNPPFAITIEGTEYKIKVDSIGTEKVSSGFNEAYCDFVISWGD